MDGSASEWVLYLRLSKGRAGISRQRVVTTAWIREQGGTIVAEFKDTDATAFRQVGATRPKRDDFDRMIAMIRDRPGLRVGAWHADRLTRNEEDTETLVVACEGSKSIIGTPAGGMYDLSTANGRKRLRQDALDAGAEVDHMRERIVLMKNEAKDEGVWLGGPRPFGWERDKTREDGEKPRLLLVQAEAQLIRDGTAAILGGASLRSVTRAWNDSGITSTRGGAWANREVSATLRRARNAGLAEHDLDGHGLQVTGKGKWPAIVTEKEWRDCRTILEDPRRRTAPDTQGKHLLAGIAVCGVCGAPVVATLASGQGRRRQTTYRDRPKKGGKGHVARNAATLDAYVSELVIAWVELHGREALNPPAPDTALLAGQLRAVESELKAIDAAAEDESISNAQWIRRSRPLNQRARELRQRIADMATAKAPAYVFTDDDIRAGWENAGLDAQRALIRALMTITILPAPRGCPPGYKKGTGSYFRPETVRIKWKRGNGK